MPIISFKHKIYICLRLIFFVIVTLLIKVVVKNISTNYNPLFTRCTFHIDTVINYTKGKETNRLYSSRRNNIWLSIAQHCTYRPHLVCNSNLTKRYY